jgi:fucokinase
MARHNVIVVTASTEKQARAVESELAARKRAGAYGDDTTLFAVPDPQNARVGSGGATLHALLVVADLMAGGPHRLADCRVFMIHSGGDSQRLPAQSVCGKAWSALPSVDAESGELQAPIDLLVKTMLDLFASVDAGLVVASSDVLLLVPPGFVTHWPQRGVTGLAIPADKALGPHHGCYQASAQRAAAGADAANCYRVSRFWQKASVPELTAGGAVRPADGTVLIDSGVVYFSPAATQELLGLCEASPLDCCTYRGLDMGRAPLRIELYR